MKIHLLLQCLVWVGVFLDKQCWFCKKLYRRIDLLLFKKMSSEEILDNLPELVTASSFSACPVLSCFAPQLKLQHKISL